MRAANSGSAIGQNRLARMYMSGRGLAADPVLAVKWHTVAKANGLGDAQLDDFVNKQSAEIRAKGEAAAKPWLQVIVNSRS
jgi:TPR repeat protein